MKEAVFDARAFVLPPHEVVNYLIWRQQDWNRNSLAMLAQSLFSHKELQGKGRAEQHEMCFQKGHNWANLDSHVKDGRFIEKTYYQRLLVDSEKAGFVTRSKWGTREITPIFKDSREWLENLLRPESL